MIKKTSDNTTPDEDPKALLLSERLQIIGRHLNDRADEVRIEYRESSDATKDRMSDIYRRLAHFSRLLAKSFEQNGAEIAPGTVNFSRRTPLNPTLKKYLQDDLDARLVYELKDMAGNYFDGDPTNIIDQVRLYSSKLKEMHNIGFDNIPER